VKRRKGEQREGWMDHQVTELTDLRRRGIQKAFRQCKQLMPIDDGARKTRLIGEANAQRLA
jgi:hypothetical protein